MAWKSHWAPVEPKECMADDVREWVQRTDDATAKMDSLTYMKRLDLTCLMLAVHAADRRNAALVDALQTVVTAAEADGWPEGWGLVRDKVRAALTQQSGK